MHARVIPVVPPLRWVMWAIPVFLFLIGFFHRAAPGVIARDLMQAFEATGATIGSDDANISARTPRDGPAGPCSTLRGGARAAAGGAVMGVGALVMGRRHCHAMLGARR